MTRIETLSIVHKSPKILLGFKNPQKKFGGKWNGWGGGVESGEKITGTLSREVYEESGVNLINLSKKGVILFKFNTNEQDHEVHIYKAGDYEGKLKSSEDFIGYAWFHENNLPVEQMMPADRYWFPFFIRDVLFRGYIHFDGLGGKLKVNSHEIKEVRKL